MCKPRRDDRRGTGKDPSVRAAFAAIPTTQRGIILFLMAMFFFAAMDVVAKSLMARHEPFMVVWARYASQTFWTLLILSPRLRRLFRTRHLGLQLLRSAFLFSATFCFFTAIKFMKLAEAVAIFEVAPLMITILSVVVLKELVGMRRWFGVLIGLLGALIIIRPGTDVFSVYSLFPIGAAFCFAAYSISTRFLSSDEPPVTSFLYTTLIGTVVASVLVPNFWSMPDTRDLAVMATFGVLGGIGHFILIVAFTIAPASVLAPYSYFGLVLSAFWGYFIFNEVPDFWTWVGALVIVGAGLYVWHRENTTR